MEFFIKQNANLPTLKMLMVKDGRSDFNNYFDNISDYDITFSMSDVYTKIPKIIAAPCEIISNQDSDGNTSYYINYQFTNRETKEIGRYKGSFYINNGTGSVVLPITEELYINIQESFIEPDFCC